ncbi:hypothetical protein ACN38_g4754 [Penicillium nordicum]|uniref:Uncharacterized protein n=1 Tax=Penicillium nordicum TaxID=229535 RepID=A0A0N0RZ36_9EURO|nr:hypothetical protein ACN38_g4754 [Penicillium nordicum]
MPKITIRKAPISCFFFSSLEKRGQMGRYKSGVSQCANPVPIPCQPPTARTRVSANPNQLERPGLRMPTGFGLANEIAHIHDIPTPRYI